MNDAASESGSDLAKCIDTIESAYEFFLAYAARGTDGRSEQQVETGIRGTIKSAVDAIEGLVEASRAQTASHPEFAAWIDVVEDDGRKALAALKLVLAQSTISSQMVDNLNASIHLRALLTDLFILDEVMKAAGVH